MLNIPINLVNLLVGYSSILLIQLILKINCSPSIHIWTDVERFKRNKTSFSPLNLWFIILIILELCESYGKKYWSIIIFYFFGHITYHLSCFGLTSLLRMRPTTVADHLFIWSIWSGLKIISILWLIWFDLYVSSETINTILYALWPTVRQVQGKCILEFNGICAHYFSSS